MPPDPPSGSRLQHLRAPPLILPLLRHCKTKFLFKGIVVQRDSAFHQINNSPADKCYENSLSFYWIVTFSADGALFPLNKRGQVSGKVLESQVPLVSQRLEQAKSTHTHMKLLKFTFFVPAKGIHDKRKN